MLTKDPTCGPNHVSLLFETTWTPSLRSTPTVFCSLTSTHTASCSCTRTAINTGLRHSAQLSKPLSRAWPRLSTTRTV